MVRQEAWRREVMAGFGTYTEMVRIALHNSGADAKLSPTDRTIVELRFPASVHAELCAEEIVDARADAAYEAARFWEDVEPDDGITVISKHGDRETI